VDALAAELLARAPNPPASTPHAAVQKRAKDTMTEFAALFASIAAAYQPIGKDENGWPIFRDNGHRENFLVFELSGIARALGVLLRYSETTSSSCIRSIIIASEVNGLVIDAMRKIASRVIGVLVSGLRRPNVSK
jgi:hypothetical protein